MTRVRQFFFAMMKTNRRKKEKFLMLFWVPFGFFFSRETHERGKKYTREGRKNTERHVIISTRDGRRVTTIDREEEEEEEEEEG